MKKLDSVDTPSASPMQRSAEETVAPDELTAPATLPSSPPDSPPCAVRVPPSPGPPEIQIALPDSVSHQGPWILIHH